MKLGIHFAAWNLYRHFRGFRLACCAAILLLLGLSTGSLHAQANAGITGTATDTSGAVVAGAAVTITDVDTGVASRTTTSSAGTYTVTGLNPGMYKIETTSTGFKQNVQNQVRVEVSTKATI